MTPTALTDLNAELDRILMSEWLDRIMSCNERHGCMYHYTNAVGLLGILQSGRLRATHFLYLNDLSEIRYGSQLAVNVIEEESGLADGEVKEFLSFLSPFLDAAEDFVVPYLVCFCNEGNLLSQWRVYGAGGDGFAIGFDKQTLAPVLDPSVILIKVIYERSLQEDILRTTIKRHCAVLRKFIPADRNALTGVFRRVGSRLWSRTLVQLAAMKHPDFHEEQEWRLVRLQPFNQNVPPTQYRTGRLGVIPYKELTPSAGARLPIKSIRQRSDR